MRFLADLLYLVAGLLYVPMAIYEMIVLGKNRRGWRERFGWVPTFPRHQRRIWIHAVSLGEINATPRLVEALRQRLPDLDLVFSTTTDTGFARAAELYGAERVFRFPLDFSPVVSRVLTRVAPTLIVLVELEVWHNLVRMATRRGIPVAVVNGRLTERSARRLGRLGRPVRSMFADLAWVAAQDENIAARFVRLGARSDRVAVTSSLKWDSAAVGDHVEGAEDLSRALGLDAARPLWVCGSTGPGEETALLDAYGRLLAKSSGAARNVDDGPAKESDASVPILAIVPRKPERFEEVARLIQRAGYTCIRRSLHDESRPLGAWPKDAVILGDTMGELRKFYALADAVFVGRSLVPMGGSDPMEVAALGKPIVVGPHTDNFALPVAALREADAIRIVDSADAVVAAVCAILHDPRAAQELGTRARRVVIANQGATAKTVAGLVDLLGGVLEE